jgi:uncharacterized protein YjbI with pentapeptide repeats
VTKSPDSAAPVLRAAEQRVLDAIAARKIADFLSLPEDERHLSASFLHRLISGTHSIGAEGGGSLRIQGARISGPLHPPAGANSACCSTIQFRACRFDSPVDLSGAELLALRIVDCELPAFIGASLRVTADLDLSGSHFSGVDDYESEFSQIESCAIHLNNARLGGKLDLSSTRHSRFTADRTVRMDGARIDGDVSLAGARLDGRGLPALSARSTSVGGNVDLSSTAEHRLETFGEVAFVAAQITGDLSCNGARLYNPDGRSLHCEDLKVESVFLSMHGESGLPFESHGRLNFLTAVLGGSLFLTNARLAPGPDYDRLQKKGGPIALNLQQARISNALGLANIFAAEEQPATLAADRPLTPVRGWFLLTGIQVNALLDRMDTGWPAHGFLDLDGARYSYIVQMDGGELPARRVGWLRRQFPGGKPDSASFRPQPYEELSRVLRQHGLTQEANTIAVEKIRMRLAARVDGTWTRIFPRILMLVSHYGYSSSRAVTSFLVFVLLGTVMYATALFVYQQPFLPVESDPAPASYELAFGLAQASAERGCPGLDIFHFALDSALPVIDLSQDLRCRFTPEGPGRPLWLLLHSLYVITGAALSAVVVLTLTGVLRQD